ELTVSHASGGAVDEYRAVAHYDVYGVEMVATSAVARVESVDDGYVATPGNNVREGWLYIDTGCYASNGTTRVELDYALLENYPASGGGDWYLFDGGYYPSGASSVKRFAVYFNKSGLGWIASDSDSAAAKSEIPAAVRSKDVRRTVSIDAYGRKFSVVTAGFTNWTENAVNTSLDFSTHTLKVASSFTGSTAHSPLKIYGVRIYERGVLVRDFRPYVKEGVAGLRDELSPSRFVGAMVTAQLSCGGDIATDGLVRDSYIESDGTQAVDTGCRIGPNTRIEADFAMTYPTNQMRVFGVVKTGVANAELYITGSKNCDFGCGSTWSKVETGASADLKRHTAVLDIKNGFCLVDGTRTEIAAATTQTNTTSTLAIFAKRLDEVVKAQDGISDDYVNLAVMRLYSMRVYESGVLEHEFLPCRRGDAVGLYDTMTGEFKTDALGSSSPLKIGGMGWDGSGARFESVPHGAAIARGGSTTLSAYAPGAVSYSWLKNSEPVSGGADGEL
ncbi:MAG: hypothetical protein IJQ65_04875, partial [Kiritimatiellae bacterium]|nr:hypothetical protein [Kiritimatiellia bacterium]